MWLWKLTAPICCWKVFLTITIIFLELDDLSSNLTVLVATVELPEGLETTSFWKWWAWGLLGNFTIFEHEKECRLNPEKRRQQIDRRGMNSELLLLRLQIKGLVSGWCVCECIRQMISHPLFFFIISMRSFSCHYSSEITYTSPLLAFTLHIRKTIW